MVLFSQVQQAALLGQCVDSQPLHHLHRNSHMLSRLLIIRTNGQQLVQKHITIYQLVMFKPQSHNTLLAFPVLLVGCRRHLVSVLNVGERSEGAEQLTTLPSLVKKLIHLSEPQQLSFTRKCILSPVNWGHLIALPKPITLHNTTESHSMHAKPSISWKHLLVPLVLNKWTIANFIKSIFQWYKEQS
jgi:hypothetical protein